MKLRARARTALLLTALCALSCRPDADAELPSRAARWVTGPSAIAVLASDHDTQGVPEQIRLGDPFGRSALYLKFPSAWRERGRPLQAFLTLSPSDGASSDASAIPVEVWRINADWEPEGLNAWSDKPDLAPPFATTTLTNAPARSLRIDVTELARFAAQNPERDFGLALLSRGGSGQGAAFATGMAGGNAPQLEVYVR